LSGAIDIGIPRSLHDQASKKAVPMKISIYMKKLKIIPRSCKDADLQSRSPLW
jgi:hypothetical protein